MSQCKVCTHAEIPIGELFKSYCIYGLITTFQCVLSHVKLQTHAHTHTSFSLSHICKILTGNKFLLKRKDRPAGMILHIQFTKQLLMVLIICTSVSRDELQRKKKCEANFIQNQYCTVMLDDIKILLNWLCGWDVRF